MRASPSPVKGGNSADECLKTTWVTWRSGVSGPSTRTYTRAAIRSANFDTDTVGVDLALDLDILGDDRAGMVAWSRTERDGDEEWDLGLGARLEGYLVDAELDPRSRRSSAESRGGL